MEETDRILREEAHGAFDAMRLVHRHNLSQLRQARRRLKSLEERMAKLDGQSVPEEVMVLD